jgi:hypothetical protein
MTHVEFTAEIGTERPDFDAMLRKVEEIPAGQEHATRYHLAVEGLLTALFYPALTSPRIEYPIHEGRKRIDITYTNNARQGFFWWLGLHSIRAGTSRSSARTTRATQPTRKWTSCPPGSARCEDRSGCWYAGPSRTATESLDPIWLRATATDPAVCRISAEPAAVTSGLCTPVIRSRSMALAEGDSVAYLAAQRLEAPGRGARLGAIGQGPNGAGLAERLCNHIGTWGADRTAKPSITIYPDSAPQTAGAQVIRREHCEMTVAY